MKKSIVIVGGGISGLSVLHWLKKKYAAQTDIAVTLLEKNDFAGGAILTQPDGGALFETGPNGFLGNQPRMFELIEDLDLKNSLTSAGEESALRYICLHRRLYPFPLNLAQFFSTALFTWTEKFRILNEFWVRKENVPNESVFKFIRRRFGQKAAHLIADPVLGGIYAGNIAQLHAATCLARLTEYEQRRGSVLKGFLLSPSKKFKHSLYSFHEGMGKLVNTLAARYAPFIHTQETVTRIQSNKAGYVLDTTQARYNADAVFVSVPAPAAAALTQELSPPLASALLKIEYAPLAVVGLLYSVSGLNPPPKGFGYLTPSLENRNVLGVVFESNVFPGRAGPGEILFRVMMGGAHHPFLIKRSAPELIALAQEELLQTLGTRSLPLKTFFAVWPQAIPQYNLMYPELKSKILEASGGLAQFYLVANYLNGVSLNDCVHNARLAVDKLKLQWMVATPEAF